MEKRMADTGRGVVEGDQERQGSELPEDGPRIHFTAAALEAALGLIRDARIPDEGGLRLTARTGAGCSAPLQLGIFLEEAPEPDDTVLRSGGLRLFLDPESAWVLDGLHVDYVTASPMGEGFAFRHPRGASGRTC